MSPSRPDILAARHSARPLQRLEAHLGGAAAQAPGLREVAIEDLWLRHQPRKLVPDTVLEALIAADQAQPAALLAELQRLAAEPGTIHAATLAALQELAGTIRVHGVLVPIRLARVDDRYVIEEGHRRSLATLLAGLDRIPAMVAPSASELLLAARQFVANDQRADLSALEKAAWLRDLIVKADRELRLRKGWSLDEPSFSALFEGGDEDAQLAERDTTGDPSFLEAGEARLGMVERDQESAASLAQELGAQDNTAGGAPSASVNGSNGHHGQGATTPPSASTAEPVAGGTLRSPDRYEIEHHKGEVRAQVLSLTGLSLGRYYQLRQLNRLCAEARDLAAGLTERHLRPVVVLPPEGQVLVIRAILAHQVPANKVASLVRALADGGTEALKRALTSLGLPSPRGRVASSYSRIQSVPGDWPERVRLVEQELVTIKAPHARATRLAQLAEQAERLEALAAAYRAILRHHSIEPSTEC